MRFFSFLRRFGLFLVEYLALFLVEIRGVRSLEEVACTVFPAKLQPVE